MLRLSLPLVLLLSLFTLFLALPVADASPLPSPHLKGRQKPSPIHHRAAGPSPLIHHRAGPSPIHHKRDAEPEQTARGIAPATMMEPARAQVPVYLPIKWTTAFDGEIKAEGAYELEWTGGSGEYIVYYIPQWPHEEKYTQVDIARTTATSLKWRAPKKEDYPEGTTFIMVVNDAHPPPGAGWFDPTPLLPFVA